ncbi:hypothetical protein KBX03_22720 [Micromonospora sp. C72]|uniref:hypothetical protein n=1 Tax=Micromonospora sp. C72 TaxID=2824880 RepID=UPI001B38791E|nr:hypothetical protein [Micromonospora sp. C72]MBQ1045327.1 hypothetical protein [Micromonospora sp. C72]
MEKECKRCHEVKATSEFPRDKSKKDGFANTCKACKKLYNKDYQQKRKTDDYKPQVRYTAEMLDARLEEFPYLRLASPFATGGVDLECTRCGTIQRNRPNYICSDKFRGLCRECLRLKKAREFIAELYKGGYFPQFTEDDYKGNLQSLPVKCPYGNVFMTRRGYYMDLKREMQRGCGCKECKHGYLHKPVVRTAEKAKADLEAEGFILIGKWHGVDAEIFGYWKACGHYTYQKPKCVFLRKQGCMPCYNQRRSEITKEALKV